METLSTLLAFCAGNSPVTGEFPSQRPVTRSFDVFFDMCLRDAGDLRRRRPRYGVIVMWNNVILTLRKTYSKICNRFAIIKIITMMSWWTRWRLKSPALRLFVYSAVYWRRRSMKTWKLRVTGLCAGNSSATGEFPAQRASNAENVSIWWRHHVWCVVVVHIYGVSEYSKDWSTSHCIQVSKGLHIYSF